MTVSRSVTSRKFFFFAMRAGAKELKSWAGLYFEHESRDKARQFPISNVHIDIDSPYRKY